MHAGFNYQMGSIVLGLEGDIEASGIRGSYRVAPENLNGTNSKVDWQGSIRGRLGVAMDRALLYVTGGVAFADFSHTYIEGTTPLSERFSNVKAGWTVGAGLEYAFTNNWTARAEYRYTDFGRFGYNSVVAFPGFTYRHSPDNHAVRVGISYLFSSGRSGAVVASY